MTDTTLLQGSRLPIKYMTPVGKIMFLSACFIKVRNLVHSFVSLCESFVSFVVK